MAISGRGDRYCPSTLLVTASSAKPYCREVLKDLGQENIHAPDSRAAALKYRSHRGISTDIGVVDDI